jgi:DNA-binding transcriptional MerR regulator
MDLLPIDGLIAAATEAVRDLSQGNAQVQAQPDVRMVRYYAGHGLIDAPAAWRGRTALYGPRHLLQLTAIKRLQAAGFSLVRIQELLLGADDQRLRALASAAAPAFGAGGGSAAVAQPTARSEPRAQPPAAESVPATPAAASPALAAPAQPAVLRRSASAFWKPAPPALTLTPVLRIALPGGAVLELPAAGHDAQLMNRLDAALAPLRQLLESGLPSAPPTSAADPATPDRTAATPPTAPATRSDP